MHRTLPFSLHAGLIIIILIGAMMIPMTGFASVEDLRQKYNEMETRLGNNEFGLPLLLNSSNLDNKMMGDVYGVIHHPFSIVSEVLVSPANWCAIVSQHFNIKACTYRRNDNSCVLSFYAGRKHYEHPADASRLDYRYQTSSLMTDYFSIELKADDGPLDARDYRIVVEAVPLSASSTFIHFRYSWRYGKWTRIAMSSYLATMGRDKVGFSVVDTGKDERPNLVRGIQGMGERNTVRYYLAIQSFVDTFKAETHPRFEERISHWFDLTQRYPRQLQEMSKQAYLQIKRREYQNQLQLQKDIDRAGQGQSCEKLSNT